MMCRILVVVFGLGAAWSCSPNNELDKAPGAPLADDDLGGDYDSQDSADSSDAADDDATVPAAPTLATLLGVYTVAGTEPRFGAYTGTAELRASSPAGTYRVVRLVEWSTARFEGLTVAHAWDGEASGAAAPFRLSAELSTVGFMTHYGDTTRAGATGEPFELTGTVTPTSPTTLAVSYPDGASEVWTFARASASEPIWQNLRKRVPAHEPMSETEKATLRGAYESFYDLPTVQPYVGRPEFDAAINYWIEDRTDYEYLRAHPTTVRVIQSIIDPVSLAEARYRQRSFAHSLAAKATYFDSVATTQHLNGAGMYASWVPYTSGGGHHEQSYDALLWSGMYLASQALRYEVTGSAEALANVKRVLDAMFICVEIPQDPSTFCRSLRPHEATPTPGWLQGAPPFEHLDWRTGGNNDMLHGLHVGFTFGWLALSKEGTDTARKAKIQAAVDSLLEHSSLAADYRLSELGWRLLQYWVSGSVNARLRYQTLLGVYRSFVVDEGNGVIYKKGTTLNASGVHLNLEALWTNWLIASAAGLASDAAAFSEGMKNAFEIMRGTRLGLFQLVTGTLGAFASRPVDVDDAVWKLREYPLGKQDFDYDRRIDPEFCLAPWPHNPWKNDWTTEDRTHGLGSYPLFERSLDTEYEWKYEPATYVDVESPVIGGNADYLVAYWFARRYGVIGPEQ